MRIESSIRFFRIIGIMHLTVPVLHSTDTGRNSWTPSTFQAKTDTTFSKQKGHHSISST
uniref:Uncharacterized protein n=1 Tax=Arundo donax TaxID=35708 RepID=A0A0A9BBA0_ARUDO